MSTTHDSCVQYQMRSVDMDQSLDPIVRELLHFLQREAWGPNIFGCNLFEVWEGLPLGYNFEDRKARGGKMGLRAEGSGFHIWVFPEGRKALEMNPRQLLSALGKRRGRFVEFNVRPVQEKMDLRQAVEHARRLNHDAVCDAFAELLSQVVRRSR